MSFGKRLDLLEHFPEGFIIMDHLLRMGRMLLDLCSPSKFDFIQHLLSHRIKRKLLRLSYGSPVAASLIVDEIVESLVGFGVHVAAWSLYLWDETASILLLKLLQLLKAFQPRILHDPYSYSVL